MVRYFQKNWDFYNKVFVIWNLLKYTARGKFLLLKAHVNQTKLICGFTPVFFNKCFLVVFLPRKNVCNKVIPFTWARITCSFKWGLTREFVRATLNLTCSLAIVLFHRADPPYLIESWINCELKRGITALPYVLTVILMFSYWKCYSKKAGIKVIGYSWCNIRLVKHF